MNPLKRDSNSVRATDHENRIQSLERRLATDFPIWASALMTSSFTVPAGPDVVSIGWQDPDTWADPTDVQYDELIFFLDDKCWLPVGYAGTVEVYMTVATLGGTLPVGEANLDYVLWIYEAGLPFSSSALRNYRQFNEYPPPTGAYLSNQVWTSYSLCGGPLFIDGASRQRIALEPLFRNVSVGGPISVGGLTFAVKLHYPGSGLVGFSV